MTPLLRGAARAVDIHPGRTLAVLAILTVVLGGFASQQVAENDLTAFAPDSELAAAFDVIQEEFGASGNTVQIVVDADAGGNILAAEGREAVRDITEAVTGTPDIAAALAPANPQAPPIVSFVDTPALLSRDAAADGSAAQAGLVIVTLSGDLDANELAAVELHLRDTLAAREYGDVRVSPFSENIFNDDLTRDLNAELPVLLSISLLLIIGIMYLTYRRLSDVALGFLGLILTLVWTFGVAVILGPDYLGITGPFSQIATVVPVLLVGLGIDYAIHLTSRYREERSHGAAPGAAAHNSVFSVGGALVLATVTTLVGFLTNVVSPLPPIADFGIFVAGGVLSAFVVMVLLIPSARTLLDRRAERRGRDKRPAPGSSNGMASVMGRTAVLAERHGRATLAVAAVITVAAGIAGSQISTTFSQNDFIPADSASGRLIEDMTTLFGGDLDERSYVVIDGDLATPAAANAMLAAGASMVDTDDVRTVDGAPQVLSPVAVVAQLAGNPELAESFAALGWNGSAFEPDADVARAYALTREVAPAPLSSVLAPADDLGLLSIATTAGQDRAQVLRTALEADTSPLRAAGLATTVVSEPLVLDETLDELTASQTRGIAITLFISLIVLMGFFGYRERRPALGAVTMVPSALVVAWVLGTMWLLGISFNVLTAMVASLAIGIGVPFGIHITHRFIEDRDRFESIDEALRETVTHTGGALAGSAATTAAGFGVLAFSSLIPMQQFGTITALTIVYSLIGAVLIQPVCLKLWAGWHERRDRPAPAEEASERVMVNA